MEKLLRERVGGMPSVQVALGSKVTGLQQGDDAVSLTVTDAQGQRSQVTARFLIACDGASSFVRKQVGMHLALQKMTRQQFPREVPLTKYCEEVIQESK